MEVDDDNTIYAVIVSESGETQVSKLGCIDSSISDSNQLGMLVDPHVTIIESAGVISKEFNDYMVEETSLEDLHRRETEIRSPHADGRGEKLITQAAPDSLQIPRENYELLQRRSQRFIKKSSNNELHRGGADKKNLPRNTADMTKDNSYDGGSDAHGTRNDNNSHFANNNTQTRFFWTRAMTRALIDEYRELTVDFRNPRKRQRDVWESLAKELRRKGYADIRWDMCDRKWRNLKSTFKTIYYSDRQLYSKRRWEFYDEFKILFAPDARGTRMERKSRTILPPSKLGLQDQTVSFKARRDIHVDSDYGKKFARSPRQPSWFCESADLYRTGCRAKLELARKQYNERMKIRNRTCELLQRLIDTV